MAHNGHPRPGRRAAIVAGLRTPFVKAGTDFKALAAIDLAAHRRERAGRAQRHRAGGVRPRHLRRGRSPPPRPRSSRARWCSGRSCRKSVEAHTVSRACATSIQAATSAADQIVLGHADVALAGGAESLSDAPIFAGRKLAHALIDLSRARSMGARMAILSQLRPRDFAPVAPGLTEPTTGLTMGQSAEMMARRNGISREAQDAFALRSHQRAAAAWDDGRFDGGGDARRRAARLRDRLGARQHRPQGDDASRQLAALKPVFDKRYGSAHGRQLVAAHRRRRRADPHDRGEGEGARPRRRSPTSGATPTRRSTPPTSCCRGRPTRRRSRWSARG